MSDNLRLDTTGAPEVLLRGDEPEPGDVYSKAGGPAGFWVVVAVRGSTAHVLSFDISGQVTGAQSYITAYFERHNHRRVGRVEVPSFNVIWEPVRA